MTARDLKRSITPGSLPYGERQEFEANLSQALPPQPQGGGGQQGTGVPNLAIPEDPLGALLSGEVRGDSMPATSGLSVGPGAGPEAAPDILAGSRAERLRQLAQEASSPIIRRAARDELRRMAREAI